MHYRKVLTSCCIGRGNLASHLKQKLGTGVFVICGQNSKRGGIFDYWGSPAELGASAIDEVKKLIKNK